MYLTHESVFSWSKNKLSFCCKRQNLSKSFGRKPCNWMGIRLICQGEKGCPFCSKNRIIFLVQDVWELPPLTRSCSKYMRFKIQVAAVGFEPTASGLWAQRATGLLFAAIRSRVLNCFILAKASRSMGDSNTLPFSDSLGFCLLFTPSGFWLVIFTLFPKRHFLYRYKPYKLLHR